MGYPQWLPSTSYTGGTGGDVSNAPPLGYYIGISGGRGMRTETITFSKPVVDPVLAIWSLGTTNTLAELVVQCTGAFLYTRRWSQRSVRRRIDIHSLSEFLLIAEPSQSFSNVHGNRSYKPTLHNQGALNQAHA